MRYYKVNRVEHTVFDSIDEVPADIKYLNDWRDGSLGDWVKTDDDCVVQILRSGVMLKPKGKVREVHYIGTCTGTFLVNKRVNLDASRRINIYSLGGHIERTQRIEDRENLSTREGLFVQYITSGMGMRESYLKAYPTNNPNYAGFRAGQLIKTTRIKTAMKEELKPVFEELNLDERFVLSEIKEVILSSEKDDTKLKALFKLADIMDMEDKNKTQITQLSGALFQGFTPDLLDSVERPQEIKEVTKNDNRK